MKKKILLWGAALALILIVLAVKLGVGFAARGTGSLCTSTTPTSTQQPTGALPDDVHDFPFGFMCGSDGNYTGDIKFDASPSGSTAYKNYGVYTKVSPGQALTFSGGYDQVSGPKKANGDNASEVLVWSTIDANPTTVDWASGSFSNIQQPAGVTAGNAISCPGIGAPNFGPVYNYQDNGGTGVNASPVAFNPGTFQGLEDCGSKGSMVYWKNATADMNAYKYTMTVKSTAPDGATICVRLNVSVRFDTDTSYFPGVNAAESDQNHVANHVAKQSDRRCYIVSNPAPPTSNLMCKIYSGRGLPAHSFVRFTVYSKDDPHVTAVPAPNGVPQATKGSWESFSSGPDYQSGAWSGKSDLTSATDYTDNNLQWRVINPATGDGTYNMLLPQETGPDRLIYVESWQLMTDGTGRWLYNGGELSRAAVRDCYEATCSVRVLGVIPGDPNGVTAGSQYQLELTMSNVGQDILYGSLGPNYLDITGASGPISNMNTYINPGSSATVYATQTAPNNVSSTTIGAYPDYWGRFALTGSRSDGSTYGAGCSTQLNTYQGFTLTPHADTPGGDSEDPTTISYRTYVTSSGTSAQVPMHTVSYFSHQNCGGSEVDSPSVATTINYNPGTDTNVVGPGTYPVPCTPNAGDKYCDYIIIDYTAGYIGPGGRVLPTSSANNSVGPNCLTIANKPYFKVFGSGISAGGHFNASGGACSSGATAGNLAGWNNNSTSNANFGSSAALHTILFGNNTIKGVASGQSPTAFGASASTLSFANVAGTVDATAPSPNIGGKFGSTHCFTELPQHSPSTDPGANTSVAALAATTASPGKGYFAHNGSKVTLSGGTVGTGQNISLYTDQDVYITGNITYQLSGWTKDTVPSFVLHTTGNIYIDRSVTNLDGIFVSETTTPGGHIYTCGAGTAPYADGSVPADPFTPMAKNELYANCNKQLVVHGSFVADNVDLMRTYGSLRNEKPTVSGGVQQPITMSKTMKGATPCVSVKDSFSKLVYGCSVDPSLRVVTASTKPPNLYCVWPRSFDSAVPSKYWFCENLATPSVTPKVVAAAGDCSNSNGITPTHNTCAAEVFEFSPELYLSQPAIQTQNLGAGSWNAVTSLPPVL